MTNARPMKTSRSEKRRDVCAVEMLRSAGERRQRRLMKSASTHSMKLRGSMSWNINISIMIKNNRNLNRRKIAC